MNSKFASFLIVSILGSFQAQAAKSKPAKPKEYFACIWAVVEHAGPHTRETWISGNFNVNFPTRSDQVIFKNLVSDFWLRLSVYDGWIIADAVRNPNVLLARTSVPLQPLVGPFTLQATYDYLSPRGFTETDLNLSVSCWYEQAHKPWPPYPAKN